MARSAIFKLRKIGKVTKEKKHRGIDRLFFEMYQTGIKEGFPKAYFGIIIDMILSAHSWAQKGGKAETFEKAFKGGYELNLFGRDWLKVVRRAAKVGYQVYAMFNGDLGLAARLTETEDASKECEEKIARIEALEKKFPRRGLSQNKQERLSGLKHARRRCKELLLELEKQIEPARKELVADLECRLRNQKHGRSNPLNNSES